MESLADGARAGEEFLDVTLDLLAETDLIKIDCKYILAAIKLAERAPVLVRFSDLERSNYSLQFFEKRIR